jgi:hypothetical protein
VLHLLVFFSVRSAYFLELEKRSRVLACSSISPSLSSVWQIIWMLDIYSSCCSVVLVASLQ